MWDRDIWRPLLIVVTVASLVSAFVRLGVGFLPYFSFLPLYPLLIFLISLESYISTRISYSRHFYSLRFHLKEWLILSGLLQIALVFWRGNPFLIRPGSGFISYLEALLGGLIFNPPFMVNLAILFLAWRLVNLYARDFLVLDLIPQGRVKGRDQEGLEGQFKQAAFIGSAFFLRRISARYIKGAIVLIATLSLFGQFQGWNITGPVVTFATLYLFGGLLLLSNAYYLKLRIEWLRERIAPPHNFPSIWLVMGSAITILFSIPALLLPVAHWPFSAQGIFNYLERLLNFLSHLLGSQGGPLALREFLQRRGFQIRPPSSLAMVEGYSFLTLMAILILVLLILILFYLLVRKGFPLSLRGFWERSRLFSRQFFPLLLQMAKEVQTVLASLPGFLLLLLKLFFISFQRGGREGIKGAKKGARRGPLTREERQVFDIYFAFLKIMARQGFPYGLSMTPYEFARKVGETLVKNRQEVWLLTETFVKRRYGGKPLTGEEYYRAKKSLSILKGV